MTTVLLSTTDAQILEVPCEPGQNVLEAAAEAGIGLPASCRTGTCGSCRATVRHGRFELGEHSASALPPAERDRGGVLLCRTVPGETTEPLEVALPYGTSRILLGGIPVREASIVALDTAARDTVRLELRLDPDSDGSVGSQFEPGQFMDLESGEARRSYSMANTGNWEGKLEFFIRLRPGGLFSGYLREQARVGGRLIVHGPQGAFGLEETGLRPRWFVAGGSGLAPLLSMVRRMAEWQDPQPARLFLGVYDDPDVFGLAELRAVADALPGFRFDVCRWREGVTPVDLLRRELPGAEAPDIYVCGPPGLVDATIRVASDNGIGEEQIFRERFLAT